MNSSYYQNQVNKIEKELSDIQKKIAAESKKINDKNRQIDSINRSITRNTSATSIRSKQRQIDSHSKFIANCRKKIADFQLKISNKTLELGKKKQALRKSELDEQEKLRQEQIDFQRQLQSEIERQKDQLDYLINQNYTSSNAKKDEKKTSKEYDFFISHATEDKDDIVRDLADSLINNGFNVWYDEFELKIGDSLRKKIDDGLIKSRYGIVIISPSFVKKNWTEYELNGMVAREMNGHKVILPIWHKITKDEVLNFSPSLADKMALNTSIHTINDIVKSLKEL
ncbi:toll/interleukin-1 receptor domain-containing protein [Winogradskyella tangerina]|uniref:toll/interleukin-1 receptor domain-containing protein n=1 Tax=Winogradskyella tangerina TaxID=2023240 RepID=UPI000DBE3E43|nr:toll/interleukin-1 receptor domain-containing protein [Winogradskyella tangerina]